MRRSFTGLAWLIAMSVAVTARAQSIQGSPASAPGWDVSFEFLNVATRGNDVHVGDIFTERQTLSSTATQNRLDYGVTYDPIFTRMKASRSPLISAGWRGSNWGFGARGYRFATNGAEDGRVVTAVPTATTESVTGVRLWDNSIIPVVNLEQASGISPVSFSAENEISLLRLEGYVERLLIHGRDLTWSARFGLSRAHLKNSRSEGQRQRAVDQEVTGTTVSTLENDISLNGESEAEANLMGPLLALAGESRAGRFRLDWSISQAALMGTAETTGTWRDVDDITEVVTTPTSRTQTATILSGTLPIEREERFVVPVLDLHIRGGYRVTPAVIVGAGLFSSTWFRMPVAPAFSIPDDWTDVQGSGWRQQTRDVTFTALSFFVSLGL